MKNNDFTTNIRTDLAVEARDIYIKAKHIEEVDGVDVKTQMTDELKITKVNILNDMGVKALGKPLGTYVNIDMIQDIRYATDEVEENIKRKLSEEIFELIRNQEDVNKQKKIFLVGLGNINVTPDSIGPKVVNNIEVTRHVIKYTPEYLDGPTRDISCITPGVLGTTGMETYEITKGIVDKIKPDIVIAIDALASKSTERLGKTVQISNTGIYPGSRAWE